MANEIMTSFIEGDFKSFKDQVTSLLFQKLYSRMEDAKTEVANAIFKEDTEDESLTDMQNAAKAVSDDDQKGGEYLVDLEFLEVPDTKLENHRVVGTSKEDVESKLERIFGKGKYKINGIKFANSPEIEKTDVMIGRNDTTPKKIKESLGECKDDKKAGRKIKKIMKDPSVIVTDRKNKPSDEIQEERFEKGEDVGKPGLNFKKIAKKAAKEYGSEEAGKRVAGAILKKVLKHKGK